MREMFICLLTGILLLGGMATMAAAGDGDGLATHTVFVEYPSKSF